MRANAWLRTNAPENLYRIALLSVAGFSVLWSGTPWMVVLALFAALAAEIALPRESRARAASGVIASGLACISAVGDFEWIALALASLSFRLEERERTSAALGIALGLLIIAIMTFSTQTWVLFVVATGIILYGQANTQMSNDQKAGLARFGHEFRGPLANIQVTVDSLRQSQLTPFARAGLDDIAGVTLEMRVNVDNLVDWFNLEGSRKTAHGLLDQVPANINEEIANVLIANRPSAQRKNIRLQVLVKTNRSNMLVAKNVLRSVLSNLVNNAVKFTPTGYIRIVAGLIDRDGQTFLELRVSDSGPGVPADLRGRMFFEPISKDSGTYARSSGLGLVTCSRLLKAGGGDIELLPARPSAGAAFIARIPVTIPADVAFTRQQATIGILVDANYAKDQPPAALSAHFATRLISEEVLRDNGGGLAPFVDVLLFDAERCCADLMSLRRRLLSLGSSVLPVLWMRSARDMSVALEEALCEASVVGAVSGTLDEGLLMHVADLTARLNLSAPRSIATDQSANSQSVSGYQQRRQPRVLLAEDQPLMSAHLERLFTKLGYQVVSAASGAECLRLLKEEAFDLLMFDFDLGDMTSKDIMDRSGLMSHLATRPPVIFHTAQLPYGVREWDLLNGGYADKIILKPVEDTVLVSAVSQLTRRVVVSNANQQVKDDKNQYRADMFDAMLRKLDDARVGVGKGDWSKARSAVHTLNGFAAHLALKDVQQIASNWGLEKDAPPNQQSMYEELAAAVTQAVAKHR